MARTVVLQELMAIIHNARMVSTVIIIKRIQKYSRPPASLLQI
jgi:hypothetical protein